MRYFGFDANIIIVATCVLSVVGEGVNSMNVCGPKEGCKIL